MNQQGSVITSKTKILIVDDEAAIRFSLEETLTRDGYQVVTADSGQAALRQIASQTFDLVLIDLKLGDIEGTEVLAALLHQAPNTVAIILTAHASLETAVEALRQGAHDYLFKPIKTVELRESIRRGLLKRQEELRQRALLLQLEQNLANTLADIRATTNNNAQHLEPLTARAKPAEEKERFLQRGDLIVDFLSHVITLKGHLLELSPTEFDLLAHLICEAPRVVSPQELVREVQGYESEPWEASETVRYHIYRLRQKIKEATGHTNVIRTVRGVGYTIER